MEGVRAVSDVKELENGSDNMYSNWCLTGVEKLRWSGFLWRGE